MNPQRGYSHNFGVGYLVVRAITITMTLLQALLILAGGLPALGSISGRLLQFALGNLSYAATLVFIVWVCVLHADLRRIKPDYPLSPWGALAAMLIPLYSLWGIWAMWQAVADFLPAPVWKGRRLPKTSVLVNTLYILVPVGWTGLFLLRRRIMRLDLGPVAVWGLAVSIASDLVVALLCFSVMTSLRQVERSEAA